MEEMEKWPSPWLEGAQFPPLLCTSCTLQVHPWGLEWLRPVSGSAATPEGRHCPCEGASGLRQSYSGFQCYILLQECQCSSRAGLSPWGGHSFLCGRQLTVAF